MELVESRDENQQFEKYIETTVPPRARSGSTTSTGASIPIKNVDGSPRSRKNSLTSSASGSYQGPIKGHCGKKFGDRKSRAATGRGLPKKMGGGGAFTWGRPGCELTNEAPELNPDDPNYDPLNDPNIVFDSVEFERTDEEICLGLDAAIREYLANAQADDLLDYSLTVTKKHFIVERLLEIGLEEKKEYRELISLVLEKLVSTDGLTINQVGFAFSNLLDRADELILDTPDIVNIFGKFIARADVDQCLPDQFIAKELKAADSELTYDIMMASFGFRKDSKLAKSCWGEAGGFQETKLLSEKIREILKEFLSTSDSGEVARCLRELDVPHFHHEIVYEAILIAMESYQNEMIANSMIWLLQYLYTKECIISADQMVAGHLRIYNSIDDITLDIPHAYTIIQKIVQKSSQKKLISDRLKLQCPNKSRKRYSSEGDVHDMATVGSDRTRLGSTGLCSTGLDSLPEIEDLRVEED